MKRLGRRASIHCLHLFIHSQFTILLLYSEYFTSLHFTSLHFTAIPSIPLTLSILYSHLFTPTCIIFSFPPPPQKYINTLPSLLPIYLFKISSIQSNSITLIYLHLHHISFASLSKNTYTLIHSKTVSSHRLNTDSSPTSIESCITIPILVLQVSSTLN